MHFGLVQAVDAAIEDDGEVRVLALDAIDQLVIQRRHFAVFLGRQAIQPGLAGMNDEAADAASGGGADQFAQRRIRLLVIDAEAALHRDGNGNRALHRRHTRRHQGGLPHQAGAKTARLHPVGGAADIQIHFVIAEAFGDPRRLGQPDRIAAAQLQPQRMLARLETQKPGAVAMQHRLRRHHLGIEQRVAAQRPVQHPAGTVGPVHHRRDAETVRAHGWMVK